MQVVHTFVCLLHILAKVCLNRGEFLLGKLCHNWHIYNAEYHFGNQIWKQFYSHRKSSFFIHNLSFASKVSMIRDTEVFTNYFDHYPIYTDIFLNLPQKTPQSTNIVLNEFIVKSLSENNW